MPDSMAVSFSVSKMTLLMDNKREIYSTIEIDLSNERNNDINKTD